MVFVYKSNCQLKEPRTTEKMPSVKLFLRDPTPYLPEFRRKLRKTPNGWIDKRDRELNPAPSVYQFWGQNRSTTGGF